MQDNQTQDNQTQDNQTLTLAELTAQAQERLEKASVPNPVMCAARMVGEATGLAPAELVLEATTASTQRAVTKVDAMVVRRCAGEPLQYVLGSWGFRGLDLAVDKRALIPRPETECLAGVAISWLNECLHERPAQPLRVADLGTGSGAIALSIAQEVPIAEVFATDCSDVALELARENLAGIGVAGARVKLSQGDWFQALVPPADVGAGSADNLASPASNPADNLASNSAAGPAAALPHGWLDAVVSNPPYVSATEVLPPEVDEWEPQLALRSGADGLVDLKKLIVESRLHLAPGGLLALECAPGQTAWVAQNMSDNGYEDVQVTKDLAGKERVVTAHRPSQEPSAENLESARRSLSEGRFVVAPTDTVCGVLADYSNSQAVRSVYAAKGRPETMALPVLVSGIEQADRLVVLNDEALRLAKLHWPGALTLVAPRRGGPDPVGGHTTLGVRVPNLGWLRWLAERVGPLTGTSANCHRHNTPRAAAQAADALLQVPGFVIDGLSQDSQASTVVNVCNSNPEVLREGVIKSADLLKA